MDTQKKSIAKPHQTGEIKPAKPDCYSAEPIPDIAFLEIMSLMKSGDLFRYTSETSPVAKLEREFAEYIGLPYVLSVNSCSSAIFLSLKALGLAPDSKVLIPAFTFSAVPSSVIHANCIPVLVNVGDNYRIDLEDFSAKLEQDISAVIISHMRGHTSDMDAIINLCDEKSIPVIEDAAHSLGTTWNGKKIGSLGDVGCFSFQSYKMINAGEGGILATRDAEIFAKAVIMSGAYEQNWKKHPAITDKFLDWQNKLPLYNMRMNNLSAIVAGSQIPEINYRKGKGLENHDYIADILNSSPWIDVPEPLEKENRAPDSIQFNLKGFMSNNDAKLFERLANENGVSVQIIGLSENNARAFWNWEYIPNQSGLENTRKVLERTCDVRLPVHLSKDDLDLIGNTIVSTAETVARTFSEK